MSGDAKVFGELVRERRNALGWTQEALAAAALGNLDRKGMISQIENGKIPNITRETVKKVAQALSIDVEAIPASLRWSEAVEVVKDTNTVVHEVQATVHKLVQSLSPQASDFKIKEGMLIALARRYAEGSPYDFDAAYAGLEQALEVAARDRERGKLPSNTDAAVDAVIARVDALNDAGNIDIAAALLAEEEARAQAGLLRLYDKGISQAILTRDVEAAVGYELKKLPLEIADAPPDDSYTFLRGVFLKWYTRGEQKGLNFDSEVAIALMRQMARRFADDQDKKGSCLTNLGTALCSLGQREAGIAQLEEAVATYHNALAERTRDRVPLDWALTQMSLGNALQALGARESGTARLEEAVTALRNALKEYTRDRVPLEWATTQMNLGIALQTLGARESGTARLEEAVTAYRNALEEWTRDHVPLDWAMTQMNLGIALQILGARENGTARLEEAVTAHRNALEVRTRDRGPLDWARTQMNLGNALVTLGAREGGTARLEEAVTAYRNALEERTRDRGPLDWAATTGNEAFALMTLADRTDDRAMAQRAVDQLREAEAVLREGGHAAWSKTVENNLPEAEALLARLTGGDAKE